MEKTLKTSTKHSMGPYNDSIRDKAKFLSIIPKSLEKLLLSLPVGVMSK